MVSAWAADQHLVLAQSKVDEKSNEITALPELLHLLDVAGCIVSIDAMGTQKPIATQIREQGGDYLLALKDNQPHLHEDVQSLFAWADNMHFAELEHDYERTVNKGHGRIEVRECWTITDPTCLAMLADRTAWTDLQMVVRIRAQRQVAGVCT
jgi:predicted transposase YbfD/YdcC